MNAANAPLEAVAYIRVSTAGQHEGPAAQRAAIERWAARAGAEVVAWCEDRGVSGAAPLDARPGLLAALDRLNPGRVLVVAKRDRLARDVVAAAMVERLVARAGARVASVAGEGTGSDDPASMLMRRIVDAFAEYERALIRARTKAALQARRARGYRAGEVPFGYRAAPDGRLIPDPAEQEALALIRALRRDGLSLRGIAAELNRRLPAAARGARWHPTTVARMVKRLEAEEVAA